MPAMHACGEVEPSPQHKDKVGPAIGPAANLAEMCNLLEAEPPMQGQGD
jgi:hypothetical protein